MGIASLVFSVIPIVAIPLGLTAWIMGQSDLSRIRTKEIDPEGRGSTQGGMICGILGTITSTLLLLGCLSMWWLVYESVKKRPPRRITPPPTMRKNF